MGELILCKQSIAANPFFLEELTLNIYSLEELSYYISENVYLLNDDFISVELCNWIGRELGQKDLQKQLLDSVKERAPLHVLVGQILTHCGYLTPQEIKQVLEIIITFENKSPIECQKMRADRLMDRGKIVDAIFEYESMLDKTSGEKMPREFEGDIWHNLGSAYARLFFFNEAALCFEEAYQRNHKLTSLRLMLASLRCNKNDAGFQTLVDKYFVPDDVVNSIKEEVTALSQQEEIQNFGKEVEVIRQNTSKTTEILSKWKKDYNHLCRI